MSLGYGRYDADNPLYESSGQGTLTRFPDLRIVSVENRSGWAVPLLKAFRQVPGRVQRPGRPPDHPGQPPLPSQGRLARFDASGPRFAGAANAPLVATGSTREISRSVTPRMPSRAEGGHLL